LSVHAASGFLFESFGEVTSLPEHEVVVVKCERLQRRRGCEPRRCEVGGVCTIERCEKAVGRRADDVAINAAAPERRLVGSDVGVDWGVGILILKVLETGPAAFGIQLTADKQHGIANRLGFDSPWVLSPKQAVIGVEFSRMGIQTRSF